MLGPTGLRRSSRSLTLAATVPNVFNEMIACRCLALASGIALARPRPFRPDAVPRQRPHRWRSRTCRARPLRSHRSPCSLTLAATLPGVVNESDRAAIAASPRTSRWRASALGIGGRKGRAPLEQLAGSRGACLRVGSIIGDTAMSHVSVPGSISSASAPGPSQQAGPRGARRAGVRVLLPPGRRCGLRADAFPFPFRRNPQALAGTGTGTEGPDRPSASR